MSREQALKRMEQEIAELEQSRTVPEETPAASEETAPETPETPTEQQTADITQRHHSDHDRDGSRERSSTYFDQLLETKIKSEGEQQEERRDVEVGRRLDVEPAQEGTPVETRGGR